MSEKIESIINSATTLILFISFSLFVCLFVAVLPAIIVPSSDTQISETIIADIISKKSPDVWIKEDAIAVVDKLPDGRYLVLPKGQREPYIIKRDKKNWEFFNNYGKFLFAVKAE